MKKAATLACLLWAAAAPACLAANANNPYGNVDHRNDAGNNTGDSQTDRLNQAQLSGGMGRVPAWQRRQNRGGFAPGTYPPGVYPPGAYGYRPPPGYAQPAPGYPYSR